MERALWFFRRLREGIVERIWSVFDRQLHYGPTTTIASDEQLGTLQPGDFLKYRGKWSKIMRITPGDIIVTHDYRVNLRKIEGPMRVQRPSQLGITLLNFWLAILAICVTVYLALRPHKP